MDLVMVKTQHWVYQNRCNVTQSLRKRGTHLSHLAPGTFDERRHFALAAAQGAHAAPHLAIRGVDVGSISNGRAVI